MPPEQHGFLKHKSTISNLMEITEYLKGEIEEKKLVDVIYFDFNKAFDTINHIKVAEKLAAFSLPFTFYKTIMAFVTNRTYSLSISGEKFGEYCIQRAVPQGSHSGLTIFNIYCISLIEKIRESNVQILMYADGTKLFHTVEKELSYRKQ